MRRLLILFFLLSLQLLHGQSNCDNKVFRIRSCKIDNYKCINDTFVATLPDSCNYPFLKDTIDGTWKILNSKNIIYQTFTIKNHNYNGWKYNYYQGRIIFSYYYKDGILKRRNAYYKDGKLAETEHLNKNIIFKTKYWDKEGHKVDDLKEYEIWEIEYCE